MSARNMVHSRENSVSEGVGEVKKAQWSTQAYTVENLLQQFTLPQIVKCNPQAIMVRRDNPMPINLGQPLLLYESRMVEKLLARNVVIDPLNGRFTENDQTVVIPRDYEGSFLRMRCRTSKDNSTHKVIATLPQSNVKAFLNLARLMAFCVPEGKSGSEYSQVDYAPGNVFLVESVYTGTARVKTDSKYLNRKKSFIQDQKYLKCRDEKNNEIIVPMNHQGEFIEVMPNMSGNGRLSVNSENLIDAKQFPTMVRYVYGKRRPRIKPFSGMFTLLDSFEESTIVGCVLDPKGHALFEIPLGSPLTFHLALNLNELSPNAIIKKTIRTCEALAQPFARDLKYKFKFAQRILHASGNSHGPEDPDEIGDPPSARNTAEFGVTTTYIYV
ncbi:hypothetical protein CHS0354_010604 [Potamilus streckersoni]|uniref:CABIT domain-containing protein n=1 Tax=Potamilus streckersoni TaxID=2493646 RepID=A0AAE0VV84_9BIVA|nr:hypothetical protein CHS0354_010604 [Potamilus streckersoni]